MVNFYIIIPTYNENENVVKLIKQIVELIPYAKIMVIDDNSPDGTAIEVKKLNMKNVEIFVRNERGLGSALRFGMRKALERGSDFIATIDADLSHDPIYLPEMLKVASEGYDLVIGSRYIKNGGIENWPLSRRIISKGANLLFKIIAHSPLNDNTSNYRIYSRRASLAALECETANGYEFQICSVFKIIKANFKVTEYPIIFKERESGKSKLNLYEIIRWFIYVIKLSFYS